MGSQAGGSHHTPVADWVAVYVMIAGSILLALAITFTSWTLCIIGGVLFVVGAGIGLAYGIMEHTEDYEQHPKPETPEVEQEPELQGSKRILSA